MQKNHYIGAPYSKEEEREYYLIQMMKDAEEMELYDTKSKLIVENYTSKMQAVSGPRGSGKTEHLLRQASKKRGLYVTTDRVNIDYAKRLCDEKDISPPDMCMYEDLITTGKYAWSLKPLFLDNVGTYLLGRFNNVACVAL